jgi:2-iminobutanoate/2-iminopropanoate deaminase
MKTVIHTPNAPKPIGSYSQAILSNGTLYASGQVAIDPSTGKVIEGDISAQTSRVMQNIEAVLTAAGMTFENVVKCSIFLMDIKEFTTVDKVYGTYFPNDPPARDCVQVANLPGGGTCLVEITVTAVA